MGFLNPQGDDLSRIDAMPSTSEVPPAGALEGLATAAPKGVAGAFAKMADLSNDLLDTDFGQKVSFALPIARAAHNMMTPDMRENANAATKAAAEWAATGSDPRKTGVAGRILTGTTEGLTIGLAGGAVAGPWGAAGLMGSTYYHSGYKEAIASGVDPETAKEQALVTGITSAASVFLPLKYGKAAWQSIAGGVGANVALGAAQRGLTSKVLEDNGYKDMASQYRIFDGEAMTADLILGAAFGWMGHYSHGASKAVDPADVDAAAAVSTEEHFNRSAPGVPTDPQAATLHADTMADALRALADGDVPDVPADRAQTLVDNVVPDPTHSWDVAPEPKSGFVRMYHGAYDGAEPHTGGSRWFATNPDYAAGYGAGDRNVFYVDVPADHPNLVSLVSDEDVAAGVRQRYGNSELPEDLAKQAKPYRPKNALVEAAQLDLPGFESAAADIKPIEMPPEEVPPPKPEPQPAPAGEPAKVPDVPLDDFHGSMLDHLVHNYGDETYVTEDGREVTYRQMANEMQAQRNEADAFSKLHEVAAACALRNGV